MKGNRSSIVRAPLGLVELAQRRLQELNDPSPAELDREVEAARLEGYKLICVPGVRIRIRDYSLKPDDEE